MTDMASVLLGSNMRFHHAKVNLRLAHTKTVVKTPPLIGANISMTIPP
jgi:hypothetical protein